MDEEAEVRIVWNVNSWLERRVVIALRSILRVVANYEGYVNLRKWGEIERGVLTCA
jgi:hypothetical protein